jgi:hypothetical protein
MIPMVVMAARLQMRKAQQAAVVGLDSPMRLLAHHGQLAKPQALHNSLMRLLAHHDQLASLQHRKRVAYGLPWLMRACVIWVPRMRLA